MSIQLSDFEDYKIEQDETDFDVVIVGAGLSGLTAANRLISSGVNILILEKSDIVGGRLLSDEESKLFYAHESQSRLNNMIHRLDLCKLEEKFPEARRIKYLTDNDFPHEDLSSCVNGEINFFIKMMDEMSINVKFESYKNNQVDDKMSKYSVEHLLNQLIFFEKSRMICKKLIYVTCGITQLKSISALWYLVLLNGGGGFIQRLKMNLGDSDRYFIQGGAMTVASLLNKSVLDEGPIRLRKSVNKIQFNDDRAYVWTEDEHYKCNYVIVAVPPTETSRILVEPHLPSKMKQSQSLFRRGKNIFFHGMCSKLYDSNTLIRNVIGILSGRTNLRLVYDATCVGGKKSHFCGFLSTSNEDSPEMGSNLIAVLRQCFHSGIPRFETYTETDWTTICGGSPMDVLKPGNVENHIDFLDANHGRIYFAASEYARKWPGTIDGAIEAGESAAISVLENIRPQSIHRTEWFLFKYVYVYSDCDSYYISLR